MSRHITRSVTALAILIGSIAAPALAQPKIISLPAPDKTGGRPLLQVLADRQSTREFAAEPLPLEKISTLLWAGFGITRADGRRTAPSASNRQEIDLYVALPDGVYVYDAKPHALRQVVAGDLRSATGTQPFVGQAALNLVYVADLSKTTAAADVATQYAFADASFVAENVYLYCASEHLATVVRASVDREALAKQIQLGPQQRIILAQSVGYPKASPAPTTR